ncbi:MAG: DNA-3-methyladenine glycosylase family protein, partial [Pseudonocardiaceae bacterium]
MSETCSPGCNGGAERFWAPGYPLDVRVLLAPLRRGRGDPTMRVDADGTVWRAGTTPDGPATLALRRSVDATVYATAWGPGAAWALDGVPALLGADDDDSGFVTHHPLIAQVRRRMPGLRLGATRRVWDVLVPAILEQKVTGTEARRSWRELCRRFGEPAPGPGALHLPPDPAAVRAIPDWEWH